MFVWFLLFGDYGMILDVMVLGWYRKYLKDLNVNIDMVFRFGLWDFDVYFIWWCKVFLDVWIRIIYKRLVCIINLYIWDGLFFERKYDYCRWRGRFRGIILIIEGWILYEKLDDELLYKLNDLVFVEKLVVCKFEIECMYKEGWEGVRFVFWKDEDNDEFFGMGDKGLDVCDIE